VMTPRNTYPTMSIRRIVVDGDGDVLVTIDIGEHAGHGAGQARQEDVLYVGPVRRRLHDPWIQFGVVRELVRVKKPCSLEATGIESYSSHLGALRASRCRASRPFGRCQLSPH
jgi:hypothetical protein